MTITEPGIYRDVPVEEYDRIEAVRRTFLFHLFDRSPGHAVYRREHFIATEALLDGVMTHTSLLQPEEFPRLYTVLPPFQDDPENVTKDGSIPKSPKATGYYKDKKAQFESMCGSAGTEIVDAAKYEMAYQLGKRVREHPITKRFFQRGSANEATAVWEDKVTGVLCKARYDCLVEGSMATAVDIKTTRDAHPRSFMWSVGKYGYAFQASFYLEGLRANEMSNANFLIVACEKTPPFPVCVYELDTKTLELGALHVAKALKTYKECVDKNDWPYYGSGIEMLQASEWDLKELEGE